MKRYFSLRILIIIGFVTLLFLIKFNISEFNIVIFTIVTSIVFAISLRGRNTKLALLIFSGVFILLALMLYRTYPDKELLKFSRLNLHEMAVRDTYMRIGFIGQIYGRKIGYFYFTEVSPYIDKLLLKIGYGLNLSNFFSSDRGILFSYLFIPFFVLGFINMIAHKLAFLLYYFLIASILSLFINNIYIQIIYIPLISVSIVYGFDYLFHRTVKVK